MENHSGYPAVVLPAYSVLDLHASVVKGPLTLRAFARNVMDKRAYLQSGTYVDYFANPPTPVTDIQQPLATPDRRARIRLLVLAVCARMALGYRRIF